jgi:hypothetical protein
MAWCNCDEDTSPPLSFEFIYLFTFKVGDPTLGRPFYQQAPNVVIENRNR